MPLARILRAALAEPEDDVALAWLRLARAVLPDELPDDAEAAWFDLGDANGAFPAQQVVWLGWMLHVSELTAAGIRPSVGAVQLAQYARRSEEVAGSGTLSLRGRASDGRWMTLSISLTELADVLRAGEADPLDARRPPSQSPGLVA